MSEVHGFKASTNITQILLVYEELRLSASIVQLFGRWLGWNLHRPPTLECSFLELLVTYDAWFIFCYVDSVWELQFYCHRIMYTFREDKHCTNTILNTIQIIRAIRGILFHVNVHDKFFRKEIYQWFLVIYWGLLPGDWRLLGRWLPFAWRRWYQIRLVKLPSW